MTTTNEPARPADEKPAPPTPDDLRSARDQIVQLRTALTTSRSIGTAIGILVERDRLDPHEAYQILVTTSQRLNRKLHEIAAELVYTGDLPR